MVKTTLKELQADVDQLRKLVIPQQQNTRGQKIIQLLRLIDQLDTDPSPDAVAEANQIIANYNFEEFEGKQKVLVSGKGWFFQ